MKIVGKSKKDYYDGALPGGVFDDSVLYVRSQREIVTSDMPGLSQFFSDIYIRYSTCNIPGLSIPGYVRTHVVCGTVRQSWRIPGDDNTGKRLPWCITPQRLAKQIETWAFKTNDRRLREDVQDPQIFKLWEEKGLFEEESVPIEAHRLIGAPSFTIQYGERSRIEKNKTKHYLVQTINTNPNLADLDFPALIPPGDMYQMIERFLSSDMAFQPQPPVEISDTVKAQKHGYDDWSFRRHPDESKKARRKGK